MEPEKAKKILQEQGYAITEIVSIPAGISHYIFEISLENGSEAIARFERADIMGLQNQRRDFHYNGLLSLERERNILTLVREEAKLPAPKVYGLHRTDSNTVLVVEKLPGMLWNDFMQKEDYCLESYLTSLKFLGRDIARAERVHFQQYGDILSKEKIEPGGITSIVPRLREMNQLKFQRAEAKKALSEKELKEVEHYLENILQDLTAQSTSHLSPVLILTDLHATNFLVDTQGKPSGYFDLEFSQAGVLPQELNTLRMNLFNYFNAQTFPLAEDAFFKGFHANGGKYSRENPINQKLECLLALNHLLASVTAYVGVKDGLRDSWSGQFKEILFTGIVEEKVDYIAIADILRPKTKQPKEPK